MKLMTDPILEITSHYAVTPQVPGLGKLIGSSQQAENTMPRTKLLSVIAKIASIIPILLPVKNVVE